LADEVREARAEAGLSYAHVAVHVVKRSGKSGVSESTLSRFESARHWPENPDAIVRAYADALGVDPRELWARAVARWSSRANGAISD
jgi:lambda repressor-like predicted transcriptional regulator